MNWAEIAAWGLIALGGALVLGTGAALVTYRRTGRFPAQPEGAKPAVAMAWVKVTVGLVLAVWGIATLDSIGLL